MHFSDTGALKGGRPHLDEAQNPMKKWRNTPETGQRWKDFPVESILLTKIFPHVQSKQLTKSKEKNLHTVKLEVSQDDQEYKYVHPGGFAAAEKSGQ